MHDLDNIEHASSLWLTIITVGYFIFAAQVAWQIRWSFAKRESVVSLGSLVIVFVFCALSGYATSVLPQEFYGFREFLHIILSAATVGLVVTNQAGNIAAMMEHDKDG